MKPIERPSTKMAFRAPISMYSCASSGVKEPHPRSKSTNATPMSPSTFNIKFGFCFQSVNKLLRCVCSNRFCQKCFVTNIFNGTTSRAFRHTQNKKVLITLLWASLLKIDLKFVRKLVETNQINLSVLPFILWLRSYLVFYLKIYCKRAAFNLQN